MIRFVPIAAAVFISLLPSFSHANAEGTGLKTIFQVIREYEDQYKTKAYNKIVLANGNHCAQAAYKLYQENTIKKGERVRDGFNAQGDTAKGKAIGFFLGRVIAEENFPVERIVQISEKEKSVAKGYKTLDALSLLQANRAIACGIDYALSQNYTDPKDVFGAIFFLANDIRINNIEIQEGFWKNNPSVKERHYGPYFDLAKSMRAQPCKITDNFKAAKVISDYTRKYVLQSYSKGSEYFTNTVDECRAMFGNQSGMSCRDRNKDGIKECIERN